MKLTVAHDTPSLPAGSGHDLMRYDDPALSTIEFHCLKFRNLDGNGRAACATIRTQDLVSDIKEGLVSLKAYRGIMDQLLQGASESGN